MLRLWQSHVSTTATRTCSAPRSLHAPRGVARHERQEHVLEGVRAWRETKPAVISLTGNPFPTLMDGLDPDRLAKSATDRT